MGRWLFICVLLCGLTFGVIFGVSQLIGQPPQPPVKARLTARKAKVAFSNTQPQAGAANKVEIRPTVQIHEPTAGASALQFQILPNGRVQAITRLEVPSERDGKIVFLATEVMPGEVVPADKRLERPAIMAAIRIKSNEVVPPEDQLMVGKTPGLYRKMRDSDDYVPGQVTLGYVMKQYRKLVEGDVVEKGQLLALVDPVVAHDDVLVKISKLDVAEADVQTSVKTKDEAKSRYERMVNANLSKPGTFALEEVSGARLTYERYIQEELSKRASLIQAQRELSAAVSILKKHEVRADSAGVIKVIIKHQDEGVKNLDPILQILDPVHLRVEAQMEVQDLSKVKMGMEVTVEPTVAEPPTTYSAPSPGSLCCGSEQSPGARTAESGRVTDLRSRLRQ